jgi:glycosyltransferase involved in cell wall biosynthesis
MKKILIISTVSRQFYLFETGNIEVLNSLNIQVHGAANFKDKNERLDTVNIIRHHIDIERSPFSFRNFKAYFQLKKLMKNEKFDAVHCHSPMGGVLGRLAAKTTGIKTIIYTAHGFHFFKGATIKNWVLYYSTEKLLSSLTDVLITINKEDYIRANKFHAKKVVYVPGVGIDTKRMMNSRFESEKLKRSLGIDEDTVIILSIGELIIRKNHVTALKSLADVKDSFIFLICGVGELEKKLKHLAEELELQDKVKFLGFRNDIPELCNIADIFFFPSFQEGLPVSLMEAMAAGLPVVCSKIRGNVDLIEDGKGGFLNSPKDIIGFSESINKLFTDITLRTKMGAYNKQRINSFDKESIKKRMFEIYSSLDNK